MARIKQLMLDIMESHLEDDEPQATPSVPATPEFLDTFAKPLDPEHW